MRRWHEVYPDRLAQELSEFEQRGLHFTLDDARLAATGEVVLRGSISTENGEVGLEVGYPDSYPFLRPEVFAPGLALERHQHPFHHNLCLLERSTRSWQVSDTGAWLVAEQVPHLLRLLATGGQELRDAEAPQGEPASVYFEGQPGTVVFLPEETLTISAEHRVGLMRLATGANEPPQQALRACLAEVAVKHGGGTKKHILASVSGPLAERFAGKTLDGRWARLPRMPQGQRPLDLLNALVTVEPGLGKPRWQRLTGGGDISVLGALVAEEVRQGEWEDTWLFLVSTRQTPKGPESRYITRGERLTRADLRDRLPANVQLAEKKVGIAGAGSLGAPIALELARAQVGELNVLDFDRVETGNTVRWTHGLSAVSHHKSGVVAGWVSGEHPFTHVTPYVHRIGGVPSPQQNGAGIAGDAVVLNQFLDGIDLVIDATGELGVQHLLSTVASEQRIPQLYAWGTEGGWGGAVAWVNPAAGGCWHCLQLSFADGTIELPPAAPPQSVQPRGCADPTFAAAGFGLTPIAAQAARTAARALMGTLGGSEIALCALQEEAGELPVPRWVAHAIPLHRECPCEHAHQAIH